MGSRKHNEIRSISEILKETNYYMSYSFNNNEAVIKCSWCSDEYKITWDSEKGLLHSTLDDSEFQIQPYMASPLALLIIKQICQKHNFPIKWLDISISQNPSSLLSFPIQVSGPQKKLLEDYYIMIEDVELNGFRPTHVEWAIDTHTWEGLEIYMAYQYGLSIENLYGYENTDADSEANTEKN